MTADGFWRDKRVLVTGATGVLGSWLTLRLVELGADVVGLIRDWVPQSNLVRSGAAERIKVVRGDVCDASLVARVFSDYEIESCLHLAAQTVVGIANRAPAPTFEVNIRGAWNVLEAARNWPGTRSVVVASSDKAYGAHTTLPYSEQAALRANHPYDVSKACADMIAQTYANTFGLPVAVTRCANMYGGGDLNWNRIVPGTVRSTFHGERPIIRSDGTMRRDYVYVKDIVQAYLTLAEALEADGESHRGRAYNFGQDAPVAALEMVQTIVKLSRRPELTPDIQNTARNEIQDQYLSSELAHTRLGWRPQYSLQEGLRETIDWYYDFLEKESA